MAIPKYQSFYVHLLEELSDENVHELTDIRDNIAKKMDFTEEELSERTSERKQNVYKNRLGWAATYLKKAGLIDSPEKAHYKITNVGMEILEKYPDEITNKVLMKYKTFQEFTSNKRSDSNNDNEQKVPSISDDTPQEIIENEMKKINDDLAEELLQKMVEGSPYYFEKIVMDLLQKMGYGGTAVDSLIVTQKSNDGGIDGIVKEDKLGFNSIYVQAKKWALDRTITQPELHKFVGALSGQDKGSGKGLFITTAKFSEGAKQYAKNQYTAKVVLIDGKALTSLMIEYGLGVSTEYSYEIKSVDIDYFVD